MSITVYGRSWVRTHVDRGRNEYESDITTHVDVHDVIVNINGVAFTRQVSTPLEQAQLVRSTLVALGLLTEAVPPEHDRNMCPWRGCERCR